MLERFKILTVTHKKVNLKRLVDFSVKEENAVTLHRIKDKFQLEELLYMATCNRVLYFFLNDQPLDLEFAQQFLAFINPELREIDPEQFMEAALLLEGQEAISHLFEVASSMDSLVVGERQILRQLREAFEASRDWGLIGNWIQLAFQQAQLAAKEIYSTTRIGEKPVSVVSLAMQQLLRRNPEKDARILLVGAGQTNSLVAKFLVKHDFTNVTVFNRTVSSAQQLARYVGGQAFALEEMHSYQGGFDCLIVCTGSKKSVIDPLTYKSLLAGEAEAKIVIDLSIPHNVSPDVFSQFPVHYTEIEGLRQLAKENLAFREKEVKIAREQLKLILNNFPQHLQQRRLELAMREVPQQIKSIRLKAMDEVFRKEMDQLDSPTKELIGKMMEYMEKKCIGIPMRVARTAVLSDS